MLLVLFAQVRKRKYGRINTRKSAENTEKSAASVKINNKRQPRLKIRRKWSVKRRIVQQVFPN